MFIDTILNLNYKICRNYGSLIFIQLQGQEWRSAWHIPVCGKGQFPPGGLYVYFSSEIASFSKKNYTNAFKCHSKYMVSPQQKLCIEIFGFYRKTTFYICCKIMYVHPLIKNRYSFGKIQAFFQKSLNQLLRKFGRSSCQTKALKFYRLSLMI